MYNVYGLPMHGVLVYHAKAYAIRGLLPHTQWRSQDFGVFFWGGGGGAGGGGGEANVSTALYDLVI